MDFKRSCFPFNVSSMTVGNKLLWEFYHTGKPNIRFSFKYYINLYHFVSVGCKKRTFITVVDKSYYGLFLLWKESLHKVLVVWWDFSNGYVRFFFLLFRGGQKRFCILFEFIFKCKAKKKGFDVFLFLVWAFLTAL